VPNTITKATFNWVDAKGYYSHNRLFVSEDTGAHAVALGLAFISAAQALSNAAYNGGMGLEQTPQFPGALGTQAVYGSVEDKAKFTYVDAKGNIHRVEVPAPKESIFLTDGMTVDTSNADVITFNQVMLNSSAGATFFASRSGDVWAFFGGAIRVRRKNQRRIGIFTKGADDVTPAE